MSESSEFGLRKHHRMYHPSSRLIKQPINRMFGYYFYSKKTSLIIVLLVYALIIIGITYCTKQPYFETLNLILIDGDKPYSQYILHKSTYFDIPFKFLIFNIGFHKCGTQSLFLLFKDNNIPSIHKIWDIHPLIVDAFNNNKSLMQYYLKNNTMQKRAFFDFGITALPQQHPDHNQLFDICIQNKTFKHRSLNCRYLFPILD
eukprot:365784_1